MKRSVYHFNHIDLIPLLFNSIYNTSQKKEITTAILHCV